MSRPLEGLFVLDLTATLAGSYCTKLLVDGGAEVLKLEPPEGDPLRRRHVLGSPIPQGGHSPLSAFLHAGKGSEVVDLAVPSGPARVRELAASADLLVESSRPGALAALGLSRPDLQAVNPALTVVSVTPFGQTGPWAQRPATEFTLQAAAGSIGGRGTPERPPVAAGGDLGEWITGTWAAIGALAAWRRARATGRGDHVDVAAFECVSVTLNPFETLHASLTGDRDRFMTDIYERSVEVPSIEPALDGWVGFAMLSAQQWQDFTVMIERPELGTDPGLAQQLGRWPRRGEVQDAVRAWTRHHTVDEIVDLASAFRIPVAPLGTGSTIPEMDHFKATRTYVDAGVPGVPGVRWPRIPYRLAGAEEVAHRPPPSLGSGRAPHGTASAPPRAPGVTALPLDDVRIADFTALWAGPQVTHVLRALGADVVKVEAVQRPDAIRYTSSRGPDVAQWWEYSWLFHGVNAGKKSVTLDLTRPQGLALAARLIGGADVVIENFSPRVFESFGFDADRVAQLAPQAVFVRMPAFGLEGPWRDRVGLAQTMEQLSGMANLTGFGDGPPINPRGPCDAIAGLHAAFATLVALVDRDRTGRGQLVESVMVNAALNVAAEQVIEFSTHGNEQRRIGNRSQLGHVQGVYACQGEERWLALAVTDAEQWQALVAWLGRSDLAALGARLPSHETIVHDEIDRQLEGAFKERNLEDAVAALSALGVPAEAVVLPGNIEANPQHMARHFFEELRHPVAGTQHYPGLPFRLDAGPDRWHQAPPPLLGQHNDTVLRDELGLSEGEMATLHELAIIGSRPLGL
jgi:crotonobetainyl-CoA:carnitine CoA-transferase CaiB-like acyl-CoA transferase